MTEETNINNDAYVDMFSGIGTGRDPLARTAIITDPLMTQGELEALFLSDGLGRRIVEMPAEEMCRVWFRIEGDEGEEVSDILETIGAQVSFTEASTWARLYGGAVAVILLKDGMTLDQPVNEGRIEQVMGLRIFDRWRVQFNVNAEGLSQDPMKRLMGLPEFVMVQPAQGGEQMKVHETRIVFIPGKRLPDQLRQHNQGWDASVLQGGAKALARYHTGLDNCTALMRDFVQGVLSVKGLTNMLASGRAEVVRDRLKLLDLSRALLNTMIIDADGEEFTKSSSSVSGIPDLIDRFIESVSSVYGIPVSKLVGRAASGLNSSGQNELRNYYDMLSAEQKRTMSPLAERLVTLIYLSKNGPNKQPEKWSIKWNSFFEPTDSEVALLRKTVAETDKIYLDTGVLVAEEVAESRFGEGDWSMDTTLIKGTERGIPEPEPGTEFDDPNADVEEEDDAE